MGYLQTIVFILIIAVLVQLLESILKKYIPALYKALGVYLPLITTNCTILGVTVLNIDNGYDFLESIVCAAGAGIGYLVAMVLFSGVRRRVEEAMPPKCFKDLPITLVCRGDGLPVLHGLRRHRREHLRRLIGGGDRVWICR